MRPSRRAARLCWAQVLALTGLGLLAGPALAGTPAFQEAPGRVVFAVDGSAQSESIPTASIALPDGGAVIAGSSATGVYAAQLEPDGQLDPSFGQGGIAKIPGLVGAPTEILRQPDGKLLMVGSGAGNPSRLPLIVIARLDADGGSDAGFGTGGVATLGIQVGGVALLPDGDIVATGGAGSTGLVSALHPTELGNDRWDVVELTPTGALDPAFGSGGTVTLPPAAAQGSALGVDASGEIAVRGLVEQTPTDLVGELTRLTPSGAIDPTFNGGQPVIVPGVDNNSVFVVNPDGSVLYGIGNAAGQHSLVRYTATGAPDPTFGTSGILALQPELVEFLPQANGGFLEVEQPNGFPGIRLQLLTATGAVDPSLNGPAGVQVSLAFGGASRLPLFDTVHPQPVTGVDENSLTGARLFQRPDGSYLVVGEVDVIEQTGSGEGPTINRFAVEALSASFAPDPSFGGPATPLRVRVSLPVQSAATAIHRHNIRVTLTASEPGDARIVVKAAGRVVAASLLPVLSAGANTLPVILTASGIKWLRSHPHSKLSLSTVTRDLLTNTAEATGSGSLR
jgi:uncharacterized delta-60 repeat protein